MICQKAVLVVEDETLIRMTAADAIRDTGLEVFEAANAQQAIAILEERDDIGLLFTDIDMPGHMNGMELSFVVSDRWPPISTVIASGKHSPGADDMPAEASFYGKPYDADGVAQRICAMLAPA
ncbi:response regulator [Loktanella sp. DJP18]|uniref:response regulator n=1 Tax=Loktanella sp. DJP18 TaxID=3409788 RepID=UPI003BB6EC9F